MSRRRPQQIKLLIVSICISLKFTCAAEKWSRQVDTVQPDIINDNFDWVPLAQKSNGDDSSGDSPTKDRTSNARVLTYSQSFPSNGHFADSSKSFNNGGISQRPIPFDFSFGQFPPQSSLRQPRPLMKVNSNANTNVRHQESPAQSFIKFEPPFGRPINSRPTADLASAINNNYQIQHAFGGGAQATLFTSPVYSQQPIFPPEFHPMPQKSISQSLHQKPMQQANTPVQKQQHQQQNLIEDSLSLGHFFKSKKPTSSPLQAINSQIFPTNPSSNNFQYNAIPTASAPSAPSSLRPLNNHQHQRQTQPPSQSDIQVLYVPFDSLYSNQQQAQQQQGISFGPQLNTYNDVNNGNNVPFPTINPFQVNQFYTPEPILSSISYTPPTTKATTTSTIKPQSTTVRRPANIYENYLNTLNTTPKPKPKAHQPALAMFVLNSSSRTTQADVVDRLKNDKVIAVVDSPNQEIPEIFVGPAGMPTPNGYSKFELPYLSQLQGIYNLREMAFFVAPMSYRTPAGFSKIFLPEPHVGSIVINLSKGNPLAPVSIQSAFPVIPKIPVNPYYNLQLQSQTTENPIISTSTTTTTTERPQQIIHNSITRRPIVESNAYYQKFEPNQLNDYTSSTTLSPRTTSQRIKANNRGNKYNYYYDQDIISEISPQKASPKDRSKKKRPQHIEQEQINYNQSPQRQNPYAQFNPIPNQIRDQDFYKESINRPTSTSSTTTTTTTTTTTQPPPTYFAYNTSPDVDYHSTRGHLNPQNNQISQGENQATLSTPTQSSQFFGNPDLIRNNQFLQSNYPTNQPTPSPVSSITAEEEYQMKQYYRQQDAFRNRPKVIYQPTPEYEQEHYTPVDFDYAINKNKVKDTTTSSTTTTTTTTTVKPRITFYSPTPASQDNDEAITLTHNQEFNNQYNDLPTNHRPTYDQNEVTEGPIEYDPNPYELPSELPPLTPNLPGLVNNLLEKNKQNLTDASTSTPKDGEYTVRPTRRPINRLRKPMSTKISSSVSYSESESTSRRPSTRVRRPFGVKSSTLLNTNNGSNTGSNDNDAASSTTTKRPSFSRKPFVRNPNRIRYQPTPEERETLRIKTKRKYKGSSSKKSETEDLDYQRDVLNQNYPVIKPTVILKLKNSPEQSSIIKTTTEVPSSEPQQIFTVTPHNSIDHEQSYTGALLEPMQIAQQYSVYTDNYGPGYFPNQEDVNPTEAFIGNEVHPVYSTNKAEAQEIDFTTIPTTKTTTTPEPKIAETTTRRSPFLRRNYNRLRTTTTTETPTTEQPVTEEKPLISFHIKNRIPPRKQIRLRPRNKRPLYTTTSTSSTPIDEDIEEVEETQKTYQKLYRYNNESSQDDNQKRRYKTRFQLDAQESQWSPSAKVGPTNNFKPINPKEYPINQNKFENEPDIITAEPKNDNDNYEIEVTANYDGAKGVAIKQPNLRPEKTFAELLEEVMGKPIVDQQQEEQEESNKESILTENGDFESQKTNSDYRPNRRGKWKKVRVSPVIQKENLETAESQNWNSKTYNTINDTENSMNIVTTSEIPHLHSVTTSSTSESSNVTNKFDMSTMTPDVLTTPLTVLSVENEESSNNDENATRRMDPFQSDDDMDTQSSLFSEVKKQLHNLFAVEDVDNSAVTAALSAGNKRRQEYIQIKRTKPETTMASITQEVSSLNNEMILSNEQQEQKEQQQQQQQQQKYNQENKFHKNLMEQVVYATSQTTIDQTSEAEICYRGRCIKSDDLPPNHKLN